MDAGSAVRAARQQAGLSQRALAEAAGVARSTLADIETGSSSPSWDTVTRLLAAAGLAPGLLPPSQEPDQRDRAFLTHSLSERLNHALSGRAPVRYTPPTAVWTALGRLASRCIAVLDPDAAAGAWLHDHRPQLPLGVSACVVRHGTTPAEVDPDLLDVVLVGKPSLLPTTGLVPVGVTSIRDVFVPPPLSPVWLGRPDSARLRGIGELLDRERPRDLQGRRTMSHRHSSFGREEPLVRMTRAWARDALVFMDARDRRDWRLGGASSLDEWLHLQGYRRWGRDR